MESDFESEVFELEEAGEFSSMPRLRLLLLSASRLLLHSLRGSGRDSFRSPIQRAGDKQKCNLRQSRNETECAGDNAGQIESGRPREQLLLDLPAQQSCRIGTGERDAPGNGDQQ